MDLTWNLTIDLIHSNPPLKIRPHIQVAQTGAQVLPKCFLLPYVFCSCMNIRCRRIQGEPWRAVIQSNFETFPLKWYNKGKPTLGQNQRATTTVVSGPIFNSGGNCGSNSTGTLSMHNEGRLGLNFLLSLQRERGLLVSAPSTPPHPTAK